VSLRFSNRESQLKSSQLIPGHEIIGTIVDAGANVDGFVKGDRVAADNTGTRKDTIS
jgi:D-arabinose 1-dehydrogenase-like Zn-dependent alcohol dehydrogenase